MKSATAILCLFGLLFFGCKKYSEDEELIHLRRVKKRLSHYDYWQITEYKVDGIDSIPYINSKVYSEFALNKIFWRLSQGGFAIYYVEDHFASTSLINNKEKMEIYSVPDSDGYKYSLFLEGKNVWEIKRLDKRDFIIETNKNGKNYRIHFYAIK